MEFSPDDMTDWFWDILERADTNREKLSVILQDLSEEQIYQFALEFLDASSRLQGRPFVDYVEPGESEDGIEEISWWIVSQGKQQYASVWFHPERMLTSADLIDPQQVLFGVAECVIQRNHGMLPDIRKDFAEYQATRYVRVNDYLEVQRMRER